MWERVEVWRHIYVVSVYITTLLYVTLSCPILSGHARYFLRVPVNKSVHVLAAGCSYSTVSSLGFFFTMCIGGQNGKSIGSRL